MCHKGIGRTFQIPQVFSSLSIQENVETGMTFGDTPSGTGKEFIEELLEFTGLKNHRDEQAGKVDLITRKMTMLAAVLATKPKIIFMDEPLAGLNADEIQVFVDLISQTHARTEVTFVIVEHKIRALSQLSGRLMIVHFGRCICLDVPEAVVKDEYVREVYLGTAFDA
jgi:branched-chain amino acid transport system ATP-binding protein